MPKPIESSNEELIPHIKEHIEKVRALQEEIFMQKINLLNQMMLEE